ncbi:MAG: chromosome segregation protein SMC [Chthoniobacterales bacterium]|nr:chromosome segregation protein SMC [Chthoniobacterales bacterium]
MFLKSLELVGFKSFVNKTHLEFHEGITSVVGPNGCGKSNILDSIRWCLGEQSAKALRGGEMADVIFSGTDSRSPVGMAEVSLTFGGCAEHLGTEWEEVCVTRRIFRDGKGEYLLNKTPCRLRDIHELFMDTGIGRSSYSIMEQGKIDLILSSRPEDRRAVFEEAAGITKFKAQKKEALRKLEYTEANLVRVNDIMREVKRQIGSLQRQAGKARRYQAISNDLKVLELNFVRRQHDEIAASQRGLHDTLRSLEVRWHETATSLEEGEAAVAGHRARLTELEQQVESSRQSMQSIRDRMVQARSRASHNEETCEQLRQTIARCGEEMAAARERQRMQREEMGRTDEQVTKVSAELAERSAALDALQARLRESAGRRESSQQSLEALRAEISKAENESLRLQGELAGLEARREATQARIESLENEGRQLFDAQSVARKRLEDTAAQVASATEALHAAEAALDRAEAEVERGELERQRVEQETAAAQRTLAQIQSRLEVLEQLNLEGEGAAPGAQAVLRGLDRPDHFKPSVRGMLGSLLSVEPGFLPAIEAALGTRGDTIVLTDKASAREILESLYEHKLGRASVVSPNGNHFAAQGPAPDGSLGWAADRVRCDSEDVQRLVRGVLNGVALATNLDHATELRGRYPAVAFATQHGELIDAAGIVTGGRAGEGATSALQRRDEIASLGQRLAVVQAELVNHEAARVAALSGRDRQKEVLEAARADIRTKQNELAGLRANHGLLEKELQEAGSRSSALQRERERATQDLEGAKQKAQELSGRIAECRRQVEEANAKSAEVMEQARREAGEVEAAAEQFNELRVQLAAARQLEESLQAQRAPMLSRIEELEETVRQRELEKSFAEARVQSVQEQTEALGREAANLQAEIDTKQGDLDALQKERSGLQAEVQVADETLRQKRREHAEMQDQKGKLEVQAAELRLKVENLADDIRRRYHVELGEVPMDSYALHCAVREHRKRRKARPSSAEADANSEVEGEEAPAVAVDAPVVEESKETSPEGIEAELDWNEIEMFVAELRDKLDSMGPVNIDAIQEFDDLLDRQKFLDEQFTDLTNSKEELLEVIKKINATTTTLFAETFGKIRDNFRETFRELFGGGKSDLALMNEEDPLESGIEITAKPPGKQLQSVSLLSGGERTMTAVALLFAIYMVKPSPFCILDEMDAPLDESNINRFLAMLDRFVKQSQFLVITHNKRTIARADVLYGVTMEEQGVSKLVGVKFTDSTGKFSTAKAPARAEESAGELEAAEA